MIVVVSSVTTAGRMKRYLETQGIRARAIQAPKELSRGGCAHALWMREEDRSAAYAAAARLKVRVRGCYREARPGESGGYVRIE